MPISGRRERQALRAYSGCMSWFCESGSARLGSDCSRCFTVASSRMTTNTGLPRQAGMGPSISPGRSLEMSMLTGAPAALALALGSQEYTKGTAAPTAATAPMATFAPIRK